MDGHEEEEHAEEAPEEERGLGREREGGVIARQKGRRVGVAGVRRGRSHEAPGARVEVSMAVPVPATIGRPVPIELREEVKNDEDPDRSEA